MISSDGSPNARTASQAKPSAVTRKHYLHDHSDDGAAQMISVIGGKLTTAAQLARECADQVGARSSRPRESAVISGDNLDPVLDQWVVEIADAGGKAMSVVSKNRAFNVRLSTPITEDHIELAPVTCARCVGVTRQSGRGG